MEDNKTKAPANVQGEREKVSDEFLKAIQVHLSKMAAEDDAFAVKFAADDKSLEECCHYILTQVRQSGRCGFSDPEVYGMAVHYYQEPNETLGKIEHMAAKVVVNQSIELSAEEKERLRKKAIEDYQKQCVTDMLNRQKKKKVETVAEVEQLSIF